MSRGKRPWTQPTVPRRYSCLSQLYAKLHLSPGELRIRISDYCSAPNTLGAGSTPLSCDSLQPHRAVKPLCLLPWVCEVLLRSCPLPLPSSWQGAAGPWSSSSATVAFPCQRISPEEAALINALGFQPSALIKAGGGTRESEYSRALWGRPGKRGCFSKKSCFKVRGGAARIRVNQAGRGGGGGRLLGASTPARMGQV